MASKSILDYEEARQRLQQLARDQAVIVQLVEKLKGFCEDADAKMRAIDEQGHRADSYLSEAETHADRTKQLLSDLETESKSALERIGRAHDDFVEAANKVVESAKDSSQQFQNELLNRFEKSRQQQQTAIDDSLVELLESKEQIERDCEQTTQRVIAAAEEFRQFIQTDHQDWCGKQEKEFQRFAEQHHSELERVAKAYERQKVIYENLKVNTESLEESFDGLSRGTQKDLQSLREETSAQLTATAEDVSMQMGDLRKELDGRVSQQVAVLTEEVNTETKLVHSESEQIRDALAKLEQRSRSHYICLWIAVLTALGLATACLFVVLSQTSATIPSDGSFIEERPDKEGAAREPDRTGVGALNEENNGSTSTGQGGADIMEQPRIWTDAKGRTVEATLVGMHGETVRLKKANQKTYDFPLTSLSKADQQYIREVVERHGP